jgi:hypothetical protein
MAAPERFAERQIPLLADCFDVRSYGLSRRTADIANPTLMTDAVEKVPNCPAPILLQ